jgi:hypothetical protein
VKCAYCGRLIFEQDSIQFQGNHFCDPICKFQWNKQISEKLTIKNTIEKQQPKNHFKSSPVTIFRKIVFGIVWLILVYLGALILSGAVVGGIAG